ncbi:E3 ubiquitin-protein ligase MARCH5 [Podospora fimiseda]|uniref:E3 ubiquitin-protein ligase MARCH5 n=1 Tax=Podospora fimiseda TaxID=252190 RepID=A0AAN7BPQ0_9PEZI|nr:E3 ubiquitin-protein ligase MARCH5 [Podospora fimiseda]
MATTSTTPADEKKCWICLSTESETPDKTWSKPCRCSLDVHESCMLEWIALEEGKSNRANARSGGIKCPQCKTSVYVDEPYDGIIAIRNRWLRIYHKASPWILIAATGAGSIAGWAAYGSAASLLFVGPRAFQQWLGPMPGALNQAAKLSLVGPGLVLLRVCGDVGLIVSLPISTTVGGIFIAHENYPTWPPTIGWTITALPFVQLGYYIVYSEIFGKFERRLNTVLRKGRLPIDERQQQALPAPNDNNNNNNNNNNNGPQAPAQEEEEQGSIWDSVLTLGREVANLFEEAEEDGGQNNQEAAGMAGGGGGDAEVVLELQLNLDNIGGEGDGDGEGGGNDGNDAAMGINQNGQHQQQQQVVAQNQARRNDAYEPSYFRQLFSHIVTSLLLPAFSYGMGEVIRIVVPKIFRGRSTSSVGLLQERWGRNFAGGCLFIVLKDAVSLYLKYRRVQVKLNRKVRNV